MRCMLIYVVSTLITRSAFLIGIEMKTFKTSLAYLSKLLIVTTVDKQGTEGSYGRQ